MSQEKVVHIEGYHHISTVVAKTQTMMDKAHNGELHPLQTSSRKEQDKIGGLFPGDQMVMAARLGVGKTAKLLHDTKDFANIKLNPYYADKLLLLYDSYEMPDWRGVMRLISREAKVDTKTLMDYHKRLSEERFIGLKLIANNLKGLPLYISTRPLTVPKWVESKKQIQGKFPYHTIVNLFDHARLIAKSEESKEEEKLTGLMVGGMELKNNLAQINIYLSQMNRSIETAVGRDKLGHHLPIMSDLFGGDSIGQCADIVVAYHRPGMYGLEKFEGTPTGIDLNDPDKPDDLFVECILKQREGWTGNLLLKHNLAHNHFEDYNQNENGIYVTNQLKVQSDF